MSGARHGVLLTGKARRTARKRAPSWVPRVQVVPRRLRLVDVQEIQLQPEPVFLLWRWFETSCGSRSRRSPHGQTATGWAQRDRVAAGTEVRGRARRQADGGAEHIAAFACRPPLQRAGGDVPDG